MSELLHLISGPRNISTALMYSFGNRSDTAIIDEPFYGYYLHKYQVDFHPGTQEIMESMSCNAEEVINDVLFAERPEPYVFVKNMAHHMHGFNYDFAYKCRNIFLITNRKQLIASFSKVITHPTLDDIGLKREKEIYDDIAAHGVYSPIVLDSNEVLKNPEKVLKALCDQLNIPFMKEMLSWPRGPRKEDGVWAPYWYKNVHLSTNFKPTDTKEVILSPALQGLYEEALPYYKSLFKKSIKA